MIENAVVCEPTAVRQPVNSGVFKLSGEAQSRGRMSTTETKTGERQRLEQAMAAVAQQRDKGAFGELFDHFAPRLKAYFIRAGEDHGQAEELAQEAMFTLWRRAETFDPSQASVSTWVFTVARNKRIDALRKSSRPLPDMDEKSLFRVQSAQRHRRRHGAPARDHQVAAETGSGAPSERVRRGASVNYGTDTARWRSTRR